MALPRGHHSTANLNHRLLGRLGACFRAHDTVCTVDANCTTEASENYNDDAEQRRLQSQLGQ